MKSIRRIIFAAVVIVALLLVTFAFAEKSGTWGDNLSWTISDEGVLTISGTGEMAKKTNKTDYPWKNETVKQVVIEDGVTNLAIQE